MNPNAQLWPLVQIITITPGTPENRNFSQKGQSSPTNPARQCTSCTICFQRRFRIGGPGRDFPGKEGTAR